MANFKLRPWIWFFSILIILQTVWLDLRLKKLEKQSFNNLYNQAHSQAKLNLQDVPEPELQKQFIGDGRLWLEPSQATFSGQFTLEIWAETKEPVKKADVRLFYPANILKIVSSDWQVDDESGIAFWSTSNITETKQLLVKTISFQRLQPGMAKIEFDFTKDSLLDCNLLDNRGRDLLIEVESGEYGF